MWSIIYPLEGFLSWGCRTLVEAEYVYHGMNCSQGCVNLRRDHSWLDFEFLVHWPWPICIRD